MDIIYESANNFAKLKHTKYHFVFTHNRKSHDIILDFNISDFRHATGLHYVTDIVIENNPEKMVNAILFKTPPEITDAKLNESKKYKQDISSMGTIAERVSDMRFLEKCLDSSDFMRIYQVQPFGSQIKADYFIESFCKDIRANVYIFIRKREESDNYVVVSFFRKKNVFSGMSTYWLLKEKITDTDVIELYRRSTYKL